LWRRGDRLNISPLRTSKTAIIIFVRNAELGKVKTRLAATIGELNALKVYQFLLRHTFGMVKALTCDKYVFYAESINTEDQWNGDNIFKRQQLGDDLGSRMKNSFREVFDLGYENVLIIGSDCYELTTQIVTEAISILSGNDVVIGQAVDGGYYLLGMKQLHQSFFNNKSWSSSTVFTDTLKDIEQLGLSYAVLPLLNDVDEEKDITFAY
jgi:rSAM/selenodomain-associated transferase 1